jgi:homoserine O-acetyltransferase
MHCWVWAETYPDFMDACMANASLPVEIAGRNRWARKLAIELIRGDPAYNDGNYTSPPLAGLRAAQIIINMQSSSPKLAQKQMPTRARADSVAMSVLQASRSNFDANDLIYALDASRNYDPSPALEKISSYVLAINSADDFINPPELGIAEREIKRVKNGRVLLIPGSPDTAGHGTTGSAKWWKKELEELLRSAPRAAH